MNSPSLPDFLQCYTLLRSSNPKYSFPLSLLWSLSYSVFVDTVLEMLIKSYVLVRDVVLNCIIFIGVPNVLHRQDKKFNNLSNEHISDYGNNNWRQTLWLGCCITLQYIIVQVIKVDRVKTATKYYYIFIVDFFCSLL